MNVNSATRRRRAWARPPKMQGRPARLDWTLYYTSRRSASTDRGALISAAAEAEGIRPTKALEVAENPTALRAAIMADPKTAEAARVALKAVTAEERRTEHLAYVRQVAEEGKAQAASGQLIKLPEQALPRRGVRRRGGGHNRWRLDGGSHADTPAPASPATNRSAHPKQTEARPGNQPPRRQPLLLLLALVNIHWWLRSLQGALAQLLWTYCGALLVTAPVACTGERSCRLDTWPAALRSTS
ncbi:hypothetical protein ACFCYW_27645, partial [Streptomyces sp. NPDC056323]